MRVGVKQIRFFFSFHIHSVSATMMYSSGTLINYERYDTNRNKIEEWWQ